VGAWAVVSDGNIHLSARVISTDGRQSFNATATGRNPHQVAAKAAESLIAQGAAAALRRQVRSGATPLAGKQIVVTRPQQNPGEPRDELTAELERAGAILIIAPAIKLAPVEDNTALYAALEKLDTYDWLVFTSANAVEHFYSQLRAISNAQAQGQPEIAAVGPATQAALLARGVEVSAMPQRYLGIEIVNELGDIHDKRILLPRSAQGSSELPAMLRQRGATVDEVPLYEPVAAPLDKEVLERLASDVDLVTFASGSAVRAFVAALSSDGRFVDFWKRVKVACIGPSTAAAADEAGLSVHVVAGEHTVQGLIAAIIAHAEQET
jgi:uroporphyrinogen-III synthase